MLWYSKSAPVAQIDVNNAINKQVLTIFMISNKEIIDTISNDNIVTKIDIKD